VSSSTTDGEMNARIASLEALNQDYIRYIREKTNQLLEVMGTKALDAEELDDRALLELDPIGIIAQSFTQILDNLKGTIEELREARNELQAIFDATGVGISIIDRNFVIERCNEKQRELLVDPGMGDVVGRFCYEIYSNRCSPTSQCPALDSFATGKPALVREVVKKGKVFQVVTTPFARSADGEVTKVIEVVMDITEKKNAETTEKELRGDFITEKLKLATVIESLSEGLLVLNTEDRVLSVNRAAEEITERIAGNMLGQPFSTLFPSAMLLGKFDDRQGLAITYRAQEGRERQLSANLRSLRDAEGRCIGKVVTFRDTTEENKRLELYNRAEKLAAIGQLSAGVAHELNTPLGSILGYARLLLKEQNLSPVQQERAAIIAEQAKKSSTIIQALLSFARHSDPAQRTLESCDLNQIIDHARQLLATELMKRKVELITELQPVPLIAADPRGLEQVVLNLVLNALQAIRRQGRIVVSTRCSGDRIILQVEDNGPGIPEEIRSRIFDPFFTTKPHGEGTGLGLAICSGIVGELGGTMDVTSTAGQGAVFTASLPVTTDGRGEQRESGRSV
jgi:signal transduction histidine kinase